MVDVISVGSATVDVFVKTPSKELRTHHGHEDVCYHVGSKYLVTDLDHSTGGGGTNTAVAFSRMGLSSAWVGTYGTDVHGLSIIAALAQENVKVMGHRREGTSGYSVIIVGLHNDRTILAYKGINNDFRPKDIRLNRMKPRWFYFSAMMGKALETQKKMVTYARSNKIEWAFNPSSYLAKQGLSALKPFIEGSGLLVLNREEANLLCKSKSKSAVTLAQQLSSHARRVVVTEGPKGGAACDGDMVYKFKAHKVKVVDTTGAGDAFASGVLCGIIKGLSFEDSLRLGYAQSTSVIGAVGAKTGLLSYRAARALMKKQNIKVVKKPVK